MAFSLHQHEWLSERKSWEFKTRNASASTFQLFQMLFKTSVTNKSNLSSARAWTYDLSIFHDWTIAPQTAQPLGHTKTSLFPELCFEEKKFSLLFDEMIPRNSFWLFCYCVFLLFRFLSNWDKVPLQHALLLHKVYDDDSSDINWIDLFFTQHFNQRNQTVRFFNTAKYKVGNNLLSNRFTILNGKIELSWLNDSFNSYKIKCKKKFL